jgi:hypothetical protein
MNRKATFRHHGHSYHEAGIGTVTILMAVVTLTIISYSIFSAL